MPKAGDFEQFPLKSFWILLANFWPSVCMGVWVLYFRIEDCDHLSEVCFNSETVSFRMVFKYKVH